MNKNVYSRISFLMLLFSISAFSQLTKLELQVWEKPSDIIGKAKSCKDENLLNFHCGIKGNLTEKSIEYSRNKNHTLSIVHASNENELIWKNPDQNISLSNISYSRRSKKIEVAKHPSIFSFAGKADQNQKKTESSIKFADQNLYELIFMQKKAKAMDLNKIHSYLSIKYGISLEKGKYYNSDGKVIWDPEKHKDYQYRPTGLGRDEGNELNQKQSSNQADHFLAIGLNEIKRTNGDNLTILNNNNFVIWSDDNKSMSLRNEGNLNILERNWEINFIGNKVPKTNYEVRINKETVNPQLLPLSYWMLFKKDNGEIIKILGIENENHIVFKTVDFLNALNTGDTTHFTFAVSSKDKIEEIPLYTYSNSENHYNESDLSLDVNTISLYPNPVKKDQNFTITFPPMDNLIISVYDGGGRLVLLDKISDRARSYNNHLSIQSSYIITLSQQGKIIKTFKLIVD
ncbi:hypothetical protein QF023_001173 [Chryseobacterium sp. SLBN-27]|uniref:T9SS type A sorting domain-containing protein n=1 Tax=Chryseobacterium sp. SLBN-27 TaxID=3042287 RepID=UPI00286395C7|nr:T9SS type A sorting domain-containing protein [Chryseobacterium sp. SLBN-27]MDR6157657.1 hypothetical protein [Chryseobacterium sp. SLBN-27]